MFDALTLAEAVSNPMAKSVILPSTGDEILISIASNGSRCLDVPGDGVVSGLAPHGWMKFMQQNTAKGNAMAKNALAGNHF